MTVCQFVIDFKSFVEKLQNLYKYTYYETKNVSSACMDEDFMFFH